MKRTRLKRESSKHRAYRKELDKVTPALLERAGYLCEICREWKVEHRHHKLRRSHGGTNDLDNLLALCLACHERVHRHPAESFQQGWLTRVGKYVDMTYGPMQEVHDG